jgi:GntR family phosphonate transport system transcriptional regulator
MNWSSDDLVTQPGSGGEGEIARGGGVAAWRQIADGIAAAIASGEFAAGAQLPVESRLAARFGVNRHTVRRGLAELAARGLVRATQGRGTFVEARPIAYPIGTRTRFSEIVSRAGREAGGRLLGASEAAADARVAAALRLSPGAPVIRLDTLRFADETPISMGSGYFPLPRFARLGDAYLAYGTITRALEARGVTDYVRVETRISARPAAADEARRLDLSPGRLLLTVDSVNADLSGEPIQYTRALFAADRTEILVEG